MPGSGGNVAAFDRVCPVSWMAFVASLVHSLAWPVIGFAIVIVLRLPITAVLNRGIRRLRAGPVEIEFDQELAEVAEELRRSPELAAAEPELLPVNLTEDLGRLVKVSPRAAVLEAFARIEARLDELLESSEAEPYRRARRAGTGRPRAQQWADQ